MADLPDPTDLDELRKVTAQVDNWTADKLIRGAAVELVRLRGEVARLQSERDEDAQFLRDGLRVADAEIARLRAEVTAAKANAAEAIRLIVVKNYTEGSELVDDLGDYDRGVADAELDISAYRDVMRAADTRAELGDS